jgi:ABC-type branched-subunit amino acid transport system substrate-binding protein
MALVFASASPWAGDEGVTPTEIRLGASQVLSGPLGSQTREYGVGSRLYFDHVNAQGGVHGRKITYQTVDDGFDVKRAVENTRKLVDEDKVFLIYNNTGTAQVAASLPFLAERKTIVFAPVTGATSMRENYNRYLFHVRASYANEARKIASQLKNMGITRVVAFYQDDGLGKTLLNEVRKAMAQEQLALAAEVKIDPAKPDFNAAAQAAAAAQPQAVIMGTAGTTFPNFVKAMRETSARPGYYGFSVQSLDLLTKELGPSAQGIVLAQVMPSLKNTSIPVVTEYLRLLRERAPEAPPSATQFDGFVQAKILVEGLQRAGRNLSTESFIKAMESSREIAYGRFTAQYTPESHNGSSYVELAIIDASGQLRY